MVEVNSATLSDYSNFGTPKLGMISLKSMVATVETLFLVVGKASILLVKVSVKTRRYILCLTRGILGKSTCQSDPGK
jgi:hypothetical protein